MFNVMMLSDRLQAAIFEHCNELAWVDDEDERRRLWCDVLRDYDLPQGLAWGVEYFRKFRYRRARSFNNQTVVALTNGMLGRYTLNYNLERTEAGWSETSKN